jgi:solute carrier family 25 carnitine/acylcarnitine transporter 20/29
MGQIMFAGGFSAVPATFLMTPTERIKVVLQVQGTTGKVVYNGPFQALKGILAEGGIRSLYRGTGATLLRDGPGSVAYFGAYELVKQLLTPEGKTAKDLSPFAVLMAGGFAGIANWSVAIVSNDVVQMEHF